MFLLLFAWNDGTECHDLSFLNADILSLLFHTPLSLSSRGSLVPLHFLPLEWYHLHLWDLVFLPAVLIQACDSFSPAFHIMYTAQKLNKQGDNIHLCHTTFLILSQYLVSCPVLTAASWPAYKFLKRQIRWSDTPISLRVVHNLLWSIQSKTLVWSKKLK